MSFLPGMFPSVTSPAGAAQIFPQVLGTNASGTTGLTTATSHAVALPASIASGNLLLLVIGTLNTATHTTPSGWTQLFTAAPTFGGGRLTAYYRVADGGEGGTVTVNASAAVQWCCVSYRIGSYQGAPEAGSASAPFGGTSNPDPPNLAPSWGSAKTLWIVAAVDDGVVTGARTLPTNYGDALARQQSSAGFASATTTTGRRELEAASENPGTFAVPGTGDQVPTMTVANTIAIRPA